MAEELTTKEMRTMISLINKLVNGAGSWIEKVSEIRALSDDDEEDSAIREFASWYEDN